MPNSSEKPPIDTPLRREAMGPLLKNLASAKLATAVGGLIVLACILGTLLPQGADVQKYLHVNPNSAGVMKVLGTLGLTRVFDVWWFTALLVLFSLNVAACLIRRLSARLQAGRLGTNGWGFLLTHISVLLILGGAVVRGAVGQKGDLEIQEGQTSSHFSTARGPVEMPFAVRLVDFDIEYYEDPATASPQAEEPDTLTLEWTDRHVRTQMVFEVGVPVTVRPPDEAPTASNTFQLVVSRYVPDFVVNTATREVSTRSDAPRNPAILVSIEGVNFQVSQWLFANHPDFDMRHASADQNTESPFSMRYRSAGGARLHNALARSQQIRSFKSALQLLEDGQVVREKTIEVNAPLSYRGYTLYQSGYNPQDLTWSTLQVVRDPGVPVVYTGFLFMIAGLIMLLCFKPAARMAVPEKTAGREGGLS